ncbi:hypothetical protein ACSGY9_004363 [Vibrio alginolyticus]
MSKKTKIRLVVLGSVPRDLDLSLLSSRSSGVYEILNSIETYEITKGSDGYNWEFSDQILGDLIPEKEGEEITITLTNVPLEENWYSRRLTNNVVIFTFHEIADYLRFHNIGLENVVFRLLHAYTLVYRENKGSIPTCYEYSNFTHDETKGCIYDMNGIKSDIIYSCDEPTICDSCSQRLLTNGVSRELVSKSKGELKLVRKSLFFRLSAWVSVHPIRSILIASAWSIVIGVFSSVIASNIFGNGS